MLTQTLRGRERDGYVMRTVTLAKPPFVEYALADMGREVLLHVRALATWTFGSTDHIAAARHSYDERLSDQACITV